MVWHAQGPHVLAAIIHLVLTASHVVHTEQLEPQRSVGKVSGHVEKRGLRTYTETRQSEGLHLLPHHV